MALPDKQRVQDMTIEERMAAIRRASSRERHRLDENLGDTTERIETVLWFASAGEEGRNWGCAYED